MSSTEKLRSYFPKCPDVQGNDPLIDPLSVPALNFPQSFDEGVIQKMREAVSRGVQIEIAVTLNLPDCLAEIAKEGKVNLWYTTNQWPFYVADGRHIIYADNSGILWAIRNSVFKVRLFEERFRQIPKVRIRPGEVGELQGLINDCKGIITEGAGEGSLTVSILAELRNQGLHPVDIFNKFKERRLIEWRKSKKELRTPVG